MDTADGHWTRAIEWLRAGERVSLTPDRIQARIDELNSKLDQELHPLLKPLY
jgi:hypothetical protein